ncbi:vacuolar ATP synthase subunit G, putative [Babesia caballi]|uniref:Vacuolar ATP synthase subunit G, putative n=1 Tax=Babesia caballi TaxID=5871 RepID=A0AAV4LQ92_BABCB|nr:vacuolar ATP synthase subunit G, putative [Babesia caballi]
MSNAKGSNALIQQLLKAEEEAEAIVKRAKENRVKLLNEAISAAENDLKLFSESEEKRMLEEYQQESANEDPNLDDLEKRTKNLMREHEERLRSCKDKLVNKLVAATLDISVSVPDSFRYYAKQKMR